MRPRGTLAFTCGDLALAEQIRQDVLKRTQQGTYSHISALYDLAEVKIALGKKVEAEALLDKASELARSALDEGDLRFEQLVKDIKALREGRHS